MGQAPLRRGLSGRSVRLDRENLQITAWLDKENSQIPRHRGGTRHKEEDISGKFLKYLATNYPDNVIIKNLIIWIHIYSGTFMINI